MCPECQQITLKEPHYANLHAVIPQVLIIFISMDLLGPYCERENGNQYALTVVCMLTNCVFMISIRSNSTEEIIKAYKMMSTTHLGTVQSILSDRGGEFTSKQITWIAKELGFIKV